MKSIKDSQNSHDENRLCAQHHDTKYAQQCASLERKQTPALAIIYWNFFFLDGFTMWEQILLVLDQLLVQTGKL